MHRFDSCRTRPVLCLTPALFLCLVLACGNTASREFPDADVPDAAPEDAALTDVAIADASSVDSALDAALDACGNGACDPHEDCIECPADCACRCGDGRCTHGESCLLCDKDCDCTTLAATPPMGWNTWNRFACDISESLAIETADVLASSGMRDAGYVYLNLDDCWQVDRDAQGFVVADAERFPSGMQGLADAIHGKGLRFGVYTCAGTLTCQSRPGSHGFETQDATSYAAWGVDYVKEDWCFSDGLVAHEAFSAMHDAIEAAGRPIVLSVCNWGEQEPWAWGPRVGQLWRSTPDISVTFFSVLANLEGTRHLAAFAGPGHWNDPDMLEIGNGGLTPAEERAHMSLWAILAAPLIAGNDLRDMKPDVRAILMNAEVIAVDQDPLGIAGVRVREQGDGGEVWARPIALAGGRAVVLFNRGFDPVRVRVDWKDLGLSDGPASVRDLWAGKDLGTIDGGLDVEVASHDAAMFRIVGTEPLPPAGESLVQDIPWKHVATFRGPIERDRSNGGVAAGDGKPLSIAGKAFVKGLGTFSGSLILVHLGGRCDRFTAEVGVDDAANGKGSVQFVVSADGDVLFDSGVMRGGDAAKAVDVPLAGRREIRLFVDAGGDSTADDYADWADARLTCR